MLPSEADVEALLGHGCRLAGAFRWRQTGRNRWKAEQFLDDTYEQARIKLIGNYNSKTRNLSYVLVWAGCRIRCLDIRGPAHRNPDGVWHETPHKHRWTNRYRDRQVYQPVDITADDVRGIFEQFLGECNIRFEGSYESAMDQQELGL